MVQNSRYYKIYSAFVLCLIVGLAILYFFRIPLREWYQQRQQIPVPPAISFEELTEQTDTPITTEEVVNVPANENSSINNNAVDSATNLPERTEEPAVEKTVMTPPAELNLAIPFTSQAPHANWDLPYQEACEEASSLMAARFLQNRGIADANDADQAIVELVNYNVNELQQPIDTTAEQTAHLLESFYEVKAEVIYDWSWNDVKQALTQGYPVIFPAAGRELGNPNFTAPGPVYHMLVIKGYTPNVVITNDPGTRRGADYQYSYDTLYQANHDWNGGDVGNGRKVIIIVQPAVL